MTLYKLDRHELKEVETSSFTEKNILEQNLQELILNNPKVLGEDLLIISSEYSHWKESRKRIDLLAIDRDGNLVVIEIKRDNGFHMDLQAIRYAAMLSQMTYQNIIDTYQHFLQKNSQINSNDQNSHLNPKTEIHNFLTDFNEEASGLAKNIRIILVSNVFSKEITAVALWLNSKGIEVKCVKLEHYFDKETDSTYIDSDTIIPLKETEDYLISIKEKEDIQQVFKDSTENQKDYTQYLFKNKQYKKGRLVLAVIEDYINKNPGISLKQLQNIFPKELQSSYEIVLNLEAAVAINNKGYKRYYNQPNEMIQLKNDEYILVCNQWGIRNINNFITKANDVYKKEVITAQRSD